jgi:hypothetical protein
MAGTYVDVPNHRTFYDKDGTLVGDTGSGSFVLWAQSAIDALNSETGNAASGGGTFTRTTAMVFPYAMDITHMKVGIVSTTAGTQFANAWAYSTDTTNGINGTWTTFTPSLNTGTFNSVWLRTNNYTAATLTGIVGLRFNWGKASGAAGGATLHCVHLFGTYASGVNPDRLELWHPTLDQRVGAAYFDFGDVAQGATTTKTFRVKNLSTTKTANTVGVAATALTPGSPSFPNMHTFSSDGVNYSSTLSLGNMAAGAVSGVLTVRQIMDAAAPALPAFARISTTAASWT